MHFANTVSFINQQYAHQYDTYRYSVNVPTCYGDIAPSSGVAACFISGSYCNYFMYRVAFRVFKMKIIAIPPPPFPQDGATAPKQVEVLTL